MALPRKDIYIYIEREKNRAHSTTRFARFARQLISTECIVTQYYAHYLPELVQVIVLLKNPEPCKFVSESREEDPGITGNELRQNAELVWLVIQNHSTSICRYINGMAA